MKVARIVLAFAVGYIASMYMYSNVFDPMRFLAQANVLAANSYLYGCLDASKQPENGLIFDYKKRYCHAKAQELFDKLEALRADPGHRVTLKK